jgi:hypothetical protein
MTEPDTPSMDEITADPEEVSDSAPYRARAVRCLLFGVSTDDGPRLLAFQASNLLTGRLPDNHLAINHVSVSRRHARISIGPRGVTLEDMGSQNGTTVNGTPVQKGQPLRPGDIIRLGHVPLFYFGFIDPESPPQPLRIEHSLSITPSPTSL